MAVEIKEKYPNSKRLDHSDFLDVTQTTLKKGVIKELKQIANDPLALESLATIEVEGNVFDDIPLFYHPKPEFWDDDEHQATDFNEEGKYFEKAWMSFRKGDEVIVLCQEGKPKFVIGFADGKPRPGENILKTYLPNTSGDGPYFWNKVFKDEDGNIAYEYALEDIGPDGKDLGLTEEHKDGEKYDEYFASMTYWQMDNDWSNWCPTTSIRGEAPNVEHRSQWYDVYYKYTVSVEGYFVDYVVPVGPIDLHITWRVSKRTVTFIGTAIYQRDTLWHPISSDPHTIGVIPPNPDDSPWEHGPDSLGVSYDVDPGTFTPIGGGFYSLYALLPRNGSTNVPRFTGGTCLMDPLIPANWPTEYKWTVALNEVKACQPGKDPVKQTEFTWNYLGAFAADNVDELAFFVRPHTP